MLSLSFWSALRWKYADPTTKERGEATLDEWKVLVVAVLGSNGLFALIQFLVSFVDGKRGAKKKLFDLIEGMEEKISDLKEELHEDRATNARIRILRFSDEIRRGDLHSKESFDQVNHDIDTYRRYCNTHPDYLNNRGKMAIEHIEHTYDTCMKKNSFLR